MKTPIALFREQYRRWSKAQRGLAAMLAALLSVMFVASGRRSLEKAPPGSRPTAVSPEAQEPFVSVDREPLAAAVPGSTAGLDLPPGGRLMARTAELELSTEEFLKSRSSLEEILERHRGYAAKLRMFGQRSGTMLSATLRIPTTELNATIRELKSLGRVEREAQAADEVTEQRAELEARLSNAQNTLRRLKELLDKQSYPDGNVRDLERQISSASAELAQLEAERRQSEARVVFANVDFTLREEIAARAESPGARLRNAAEAGFGEASASLVGLLVFLIGRGPVILLWCAIFYFPVRLAWKKWQPIAQPTAAQGD